MRFRGERVVLGRVRVALRTRGRVGDPLGARAQVARLVAEGAQQLDAPKSTLFSEVHKLFRSAGRNTSNNNGGGMAARASSRTNLKRVDSNASTESGLLDRTSSNRSLHKAPSSGSVRRGANSSRKLLQSTSTSSMASRSSAHRLVRAGSKKK